VNYIKENLVQGVSNNEDLVKYIKAETLFLLSVVLGWQDEICNYQKQINWLANYNVYDLSGYSPFSIIQFKIQEQLFFQQHLDHLPASLYPTRYKIVYFDLTE